MEYNNDSNPVANQVNLRDRGLLDLKFGGRRDTGRHSGGGMKGKRDEGDARAVEQRGRKFGGRSRRYMANTREYKRGRAFKRKNRK
ncbi:hypothetical protein Pyn_37712 [Prunus yedoensis var. nudiflora]|uniref:Uncharacterized protein n=1 Tax=Prunus yedoensis var. nudiflora TaxID=2094558 RepID=A0A315APV0_PRUYE|nr:hypothetical protein Pyn_37712 [Prunus yedoensis var. nudiflora]